MGSSVSNIPGNDLYSPQTNQNAPSKSLDKNAFLQLLVTQMQYQDPTQPMDNTQFIAQLAQFSSLEQMSNVASTGSQQLQVNGLSLGAELLGNDITYKDANGQDQTGTVSSVQMVSGVVKVQVGTDLVDLSNVETVTKKS